MGEIIYMREGLFGPRVSVHTRTYGKLTNHLRSYARLLGKVAKRVWRGIKACFYLVWVLLLGVAMLPGITLYALFFLFCLALGFGILFEVGKALTIVGN
jgi:hypothetical protein